MVTAVSKLSSGYEHEVCTEPKKISILGLSFMVLISRSLYTNILDSKTMQKRRVCVALPSSFPATRSSWLAWTWKITAFGRAPEINLCIPSHQPLLQASTRGCTRATVPTRRSRSCNLRLRKRPIQVCAASSCSK